MSEFCNCNTTNIQQVMCVSYDSECNTFFPVMIPDIGRYVSSNHMGCKFMRLWHFLTLQQRQFIILSWCNLMLSFRLTCPLLMTQAQCKRYLSDFNKGSRESNVPIIIQECLAKRGVHL